MASRERSFNVFLATLKEDFKTQQRINMDRDPAMKDIDNAVLLIKGNNQKFLFLIEIVAVCSVYGVKKFCKYNNTVHMILLS